MAYRVTGASAFNFGIEWEKVPGDEDLAAQVMIFMADRRLLFGDRHGGDEQYCVTSANEIRRFLTDQIVASKPGRTLRQRLSLLREAARHFVDRGGHDAGHYQEFPVRFGLALGDLRTAFAIHLAAIAEEFDLEMEWELARLVYPEDHDDADGAEIAT
jgi:hypothetical protein